MENLDFSITFYKQTAVHVELVFKSMTLCFLNPNLEMYSVLHLLYMHCDPLLLPSQAKPTKTGMLFIQIDTQC